MARKGVEACAGLGSKVTVDEAKFRDLWSKGVSVARIAAELGVTTDSLNRVRVRLGMPARTPRTRAKPEDTYRDPTPEEIAERSAAIRASWPPEVEAKRRVCKPAAPYEIPSIRISDIGDAMQSAP